jgi:hypothetical protein
MADKKEDGRSAQEATIGIRQKQVTIAIYSGENSLSLGGEVKARSPHLRASEYLGFGPTTEMRLGGGDD